MLRIVVKWLKSRIYHYITCIYVLIGTLQRAHLPAALYSLNLQYLQLRPIDKSYSTS